MNLHYIILHLFIFNSFFIFILKLQLQICNKKYLQECIMPLGFINFSGGLPVVALRDMNNVWFVVGVKRTREPGH